MPVRLPSLLGLFNRSLRRQRFRRFDGAAGGRRGWGMGIFHRINPALAAGGASLRARARYLANNSLWIVNAIGNWVGALGGFGVTPTSQQSDAAARKALATAAEPFDESAMTAEATISTVSDVNRIDGRGAYVERQDPAGLDASRLVGAPVLDGHRQASARDTIGVVTAYRTEGNALASTIRLLLRGHCPELLRHDVRPAERHVLGLPRHRWGSLLTKNSLCRGSP